MRRFKAHASIDGCIHIMELKLWEEPDKASWDIRSNGANWRVAFYGSDYVDTRTMYPIPKHIDRALRDYIDFLVEKAYAGCQVAEYV